MKKEKPNNIFEIYFKKIFDIYKRGDATELSFYSTLEKFLEEMGNQQNKNIQVTSLPKRTEAGNPDFRVWDGKHKIIGYIEAKPIETRSLEVIEDTEQLKRYRKTFPNFILTNFFEFRHYRNGKLINRVEISRPFILIKGRMVPQSINDEKFGDLLDHFFSFSIPKTYTAKALAIELAKRTRFLRDQVIVEELKEEEQKESGHLLGFYKTFKKHLISSLTLKAFADLYAQTITYGLFVARSRAENGFNRKLAYDYIPQTIGILRDIFNFISFGEMPTQMEWIIDDIAEVLAVAGVKEMMSDFYKEGKGIDPIIHFYETFLAEYDPKEREKRGVYYTPEPVVSYIVCSIHKLLKEKFNREDGFATQSVTVLDPAAGTLTFPAYAIHQAIQEYKSKYGDGGIKNLIKEHILKNFYAFELMMAPYAVGHLKISFVLDKYGYKLSENERFNLYLTNTLEFTAEDPNRLPGILEQTIAKESGEALNVKENIPIMVIMGNPPYSGISENKGEWILKQIAEYRQIEGKPLGERKDWLQDDYVKFIRFAQWKIEQTGIGILGFITNHAWLDNPTFRGMRYSLLKSFDEIYILNLHGSTLKREKTSAGKKDENVFDIRPGVAISIFLKLKKPKEKKVFYVDQWGLREKKYDWLEKNNIESTLWQDITPEAPYYFFIPQKTKGRKEYETFSKITEIFQVNSTGIVTARDHFVIDTNRESLEARIRIFRDSSEDDDFIKQALSLKENYAWRVTKARDKLKKVKNWESYFTKILYRPFDERWIYYHPSVVWRIRENVMKHMLRPNLALMTIRQIFKDDPFAHAFVTDKITDINSLHSPGVQVLFPLYIYDDEEDQRTIFEGQEQLDIKGAQHKLDWRFKKENKKLNIDSKLFNTLESVFSKKLLPEEIFYYIYSIFYSNAYRQKYQEFLKIDFPRIPFTKDYKLFQRFAEFGKQLADLHLLKSLKLNKPIAKFSGQGNNLVKVRKYNEKNKRIYINSTQYFSGVEKEIWEYMIGGYQVLDKWLKDRKHKYLSAEEIKHYCQIVTSFKETIEIQKEIDKLYSKIEKDLVA